MRGCNWGRTAQAGWRLEGLLGRHPNKYKAPRSMLGLRMLANTLILMAMSVGIAVGFLVTPFVLGFMVAYEWVAEYVDGAAIRLRARQDAKEKAEQ